MAPEEIDGTKVVNEDTKADAIDVEEPKAKIFIRTTQEVALEDPEKTIVYAEEKMLVFYDATTVTVKDMV